MPSRISSALNHELAGAIIGLENEYSLQCTTGEEEAGRFLEATGLWSPQKTMQARGSRLYVDCGNHPEVATAECRKVRDLVIGDLASIALLEIGIEQANSSTPEIKKWRLFRNNTGGVLSASDTPKYWASHENYLYPKTAWGALAPLGSFFATRVYAGTGTILHANSNPTFQISQRAPFTHFVIKSAATLNDGKPMIISRDEPHSNEKLRNDANDKYMRIQVACGDSTQLPYATGLRFGATILALKTLAAGLEPSVAHSDYKWPLAFKIFSKDPDMQTTIPIKNKQLTALDIQWEWLNAAQKYKEQYGLDDELSQILEMWGDTLNALENRPSELFGKVEWITKRLWLESYAERRNLQMTDNKVKAQDIFFHEIGIGSICSRLRSSERAPVFSSEAEVKSAMTAPPATTRAALRGYLISFLDTNGFSYEADWEKIKTINYNNRAIRGVFEMQNPFDTDLERVKKFIDQVLVPHLKR